MSLDDNIETDRGPLQGLLPTIYPPSPPIASLEGGLEAYWGPGEAFAQMHVRIERAEPPLELLEQLGSSPFDRGGFPLIGFLATTYERVSRYAVQRGTR